MADLPNPHDAFFREMLSSVEAARDFVAHYLPAEVVACFDLGTLRVSKDSCVDEELRSHYSDLHYEVVLRNGGDALVYLLFEHKSHPEPEAGLDLLRYTVKARGLWRKQDGSDGTGQWCLTDPAPAALQAPASPHPKPPRKGTGHSCF